MAKKTFLRKTLAIALAAMLTIGAGPLAGLCGLELPSLSSFTASAAEDEIVWTVATDDMFIFDGNTIKGYTSKLAGNIELPTKTANGTAITRIADNAFKNCTDLTAVKIPETIVSIGSRAFADCGLETVYFNAIACDVFNNANEGYSLFTGNSNLTKVVFGENVTKIPECVCGSIPSLQKVEFKATVVEIGESAFYNCPSLEAIDLSTVETIGEHAFSGCTTLKVTDKNTATESDKGSIVFSDNLLRIGGHAFENCTSIKEVTVPENVETTGYRAFANSGLETVYFNAIACDVFNNANEGHSLFSGNSNLTKVVFGDKVTKIPECVCGSIANLQKVEFKATVVEIGESAFANCPSLEAIDLSTVETIGEHAFSGCTTLKVTDKNTATESDKGSIVFLDNLLSIGGHAFENCTSIKEVTVPENVETTGYRAFANCGLETVYFNATACDVYNNANEGHSLFSGNSNLTKVVFGDKVTKIPECVCGSIANLQKVEFKATVVEIGESAFANCPSLEAIDLSTVETIGDSAFANCTTLKATDKNVATENDKGTIFFSNNLLSIGGHAFENCTSIKEVTVPEKVEATGYRAFANSGLETVYFNATACDVYNNANEGHSLFSGNSSLTKVVFGENVTKIPEYVCGSIANLQNVEFKGEVTAIGAYAFYNCPSLENIHLEAYSEEDFDISDITIGKGNDIVTEDIFTFGTFREEKTNREFGVTVSYINKAFNEEVKLSVSEAEGEHENGTVYILDSEIREQVGCFNIKMISIATNETVQPADRKTVRVTMPIPEKYLGKTNFKIVHYLENETKENFSTDSKNKNTKITVSEDGKYLVFEVSSFSKFEVMTFEPAPSVSIRNNNGAKTIGFGDTLRLTAVAENMPEGAKIFWYVDGVKRGEGATFEVSPESGSVDVTVKVVDEDGKAYESEDASDSQKVTVKSGFFQKLISFFKNLFGISRIVAQAFKVK